MQEGKLGVAFHPSPSLAFGLSARRRPFLDAAEPLDTNESQFYGAGGGGALMLARVAHRGVDEIRFSAQGSPVPWGYFYVEALGERITDGNGAAGGNAAFRLGPFGLHGEPVPV
ncbi:MAG TPA: hypothetical protein VE782_16850, partial [Myxococcaceae bacterium]|nr:hypothetical protein [Myxococcaceae bacterium]